MEQQKTLLHKPIGLEKICSSRIADVAEKVKKKRENSPVYNLIKGINFREGIRMPYLKKITRVRNKLYVEKVYSARYGKNTIPGPKQKKTREAVRKVNERNRIKKLSWLIEENFEAGDWHVVLTFRKESRTTDQMRIREIRKEFLKALRKIYRKAGEELKYIIVIEHLKTTVHFHAILNDIPKFGKRIREAWTWGNVNLSPLYESEGGFMQLASYLLKEAGEKEKGEQTYTRSRNLHIPETTVEVIKSRKWRKEPKALKGYYIEKNSLYEGINDWGYWQQYYTLVKIEGKEKDDG